MIQTDRTEGISTMPLPANITIDALHPNILKGYGAAIQGTDSNGTMDIEFRSLHDATAWAVTCDITSRCYLREDTALRSFDKAVVIQFTPAP